MTLQILRSQLNAMDYDFESAVAAYVSDLINHRTSGTARPSANPLIEAAVRRERTPVLDQPSAKAQLATLVCQNLAGQFEASIAAAKARLDHVRGARTVVQKVKTKILGDPHADAAQAIQQMEATLVQLKSGRLPVQFQHLVPATAPPIHEGADTFMADYQIIEDVAEEAA